jgi:putative peptide zinc metalloprotease protein
VTAGQRVAEGDLLFELTSPELVQQRQIVGSELRALDWQLDRHHLAQDARWNTQVLRQQKRTAQAKSRSLDERAQRLQIFAPFDGVVFDVDESLQEGSWVDAERVLGYLADVNEFIAEGYVQEKYLNRLSVHATGVVYSDMNRGSPQPINIQSIDRTQSSVLPQSYLASVYDGPIAVREQNGQLIPESSVYKVLLNLDGNELLRPRLIYRGEAHLQGERETIVYAAYRTIASVLVRESGF